MAYGQWSAEAVWDPELFDLIEDGDCLQVWHGQDLVYAGPMTRRPRFSRGGVELAGMGHKFWLGLDDVGPIVEDEEFVAGTNRLSNGGAEFDFEHWRAAENTQWIIVTGGNVIAGSHGFQVRLDPPADDVLQSDEAIDAKPGMQFQFGAFARRVYGDVGRLRFRLVYVGRFDNPNLLPAFDSGAWTDESEDPTDCDIVGDLARMGPTTRKAVALDLSTWTDASEVPADTATSGTHLYIGPTTRRQLLPNPYFATGAYAPEWTVTGGTWSIESVSPPPTGSGFFAHVEPGPLEGLGDSVDVGPGEEYRVRGYIRPPDPGDGGDGAGLIQVNQGAVDPPGSLIVDPDVVVTSHFTNEISGNPPPWGAVEVSLTVRDDCNKLGVILVEKNCTSGGFDFSGAVVERTKGNRAARFSPTFDVTPERDYVGSVNIHCAPEVHEGTLHLTAVYLGPSLPVLADDVAQIETTKGGADKILTFSLKPPAGYDECYLRFEGRDVYGNAFDISAPNLVRTNGNSCRLRSNPIAVTPQRTYRGLHSVGTDAGVVGGRLRVVARFSAAGRAEVLADVGTFEAEASTVKLLDFRVTPPSGYDELVVDFVGEDIYGGSLYIHPGSLIDEDVSTRVADVKTPQAVGAYTPYSITVTAPDGTEGVHGELVAEERGEGWLVDEAFLKRTGAPISTARDVITRLCRKANGQPAVVAGSIDNGPLPWDLHYRNQVNAEIVDQFSRATMDPQREYDISPTNVLSWGRSSDLFEDRTDFVVARAVPWLLLDEPDIEQSSEDAVQVLKLIGADRPAVGGRRSSLEATATNDPGGRLDYFGVPWERMKIESDTTLDHADLVRLKARLIADQLATTRRTVPLSLSDVRAYGQCPRPGDWIYVYLPDQGLVDETNEMGFGAYTVWPERIRIMVRRIKPGSGPWRFEIRRGNGTVYDITHLVGPLLPGPTTVEFEVGDFQPEFSIDPQGLAMENQLLRYLASSTRR